MARRRIQSAIAMVSLFSNGRSFRNATKTSHTASMKDCRHSISFRESTMAPQILVEWITLRSARETRTASWSLSWKSDSSTSLAKARNRSRSAWVRRLERVFQARWRVDVPQSCHALPTKFSVKSTINE
jgi:hypothetical protein